MIQFILFILLISYFVFLLKKRHIDKVPLFKKKRFDLLGYVLMFVFGGYSVFKMATEKQSRVDRNSAEIAKIEEKKQKQEEVDSKNWVQSHLAREYIDRFKNIIESRKDINVRIDNVGTKVETSSFQGAVYTTLHVTLNLRNDYGVATKSQFNSGMKKLIKMWVDEYPVSETVLVSILAISPDGTIVGQVSSEHQDPIISGYGLSR